MPLKHSTPRNRTARKSSRSRKTRHGRPNQLRPDRLNRLIDEQAGGSRSRFARSLGIGTTHVTNWLNNGIAPSAAMLARIAEQTGASIDWLLGFDVPPSRDARAQAGHLARQLFEALDSATPQFAPRSLLGDRAALDDRPARVAEVVTGVVRSWWQLQRELHAQKFGTALLMLADRLLDDSGQVSDQRIATLMRQKARELRNRAALLRNADASWREMFDLLPGPLDAEIPGVTSLALKNRDETMTAYLRAPYRALGGQAGIGVAWRVSPVKDEAWFIDADSLKVRHERSPRFLSDLTIAERFPPV